MQLLNIACCLWDANKHSHDFSRCYDEAWVEKLYRGFKRNLSIPFQFVVFTDKRRPFKEPIEQEILVTQEPSYGCLIEPFKLNEPTIICGLDMLVIDRIDHMARYCLEGKEIALPAHPSKPHVTINPIVFVPKGHRNVFDEWRGENDMEWLKTRTHIKTDTMWPGQIQSFKLHDLRRRGIHGARIVYFHGRPKMQDLVETQAWVKAAWV